MARNDSQEFLPQPFMQLATPTYSSASTPDSSDREAPADENQVVPTNHRQDAGPAQFNGGSQNSAETKTLTAEDEDIVPAQQSIPRVSSAASCSTQSHSPKSGHDFSEYSPDTNEDKRNPQSSITSKQRYRMSVEATKHAKGRKKRSHSAVEESGKKAM